MRGTRGDRAARVAMGLLVALYVIVMAASFAYPEEIRGGIVAGDGIEYLGAATLRMNDDGTGDLVTEGARLTFTWDYRRDGEWLLRFDAGWEAWLIRDGDVYRIVAPGAVFVGTRQEPDAQSVIQETPDEPDEQCQIWEDLARRAMGQLWAVCEYVVATYGEVPNDCYLYMTADR